MRQEIDADPWEADDWDMKRGSRVWVHLIPASQWVTITGQWPPQPPVTAKDYEGAELPWFDYYKDSPSMSVAGVKALAPHAPAQAIVEWSW